MLKITFGEIEHGWAQMWFDTDSERLTVAASYLTEPFADLADVAFAMLQGKPEAIMQLATEPGEYRLIATKTDSTYHLRLERWTDLFCCPKEDNKLEALLFEVPEVAPKAFGLQILVELKRIAPLSGVQEWQMNDDDEMNPVPDTEYSGAKIAELEKALME
ncbi:MAG: hypothetical protein NTV80_12045 [Verrucomicrobia bacterium]|nr:hypothetical protein [Verrucomicrobiota bacterium]